MACAHIVVGDEAVGRAIMRYHVGHHRRLIFLTEPLALKADKWSSRWGEKPCFAERQYRRLKYFS